MEYLLVLQVPGSSIRSYQEMAAIERRVAATLGELGKVDGHEAGWGEMRIFILTPKPIEAVDRLREVPEIAELDLNPLKVLRPGKGCMAVDARVGVRA